MSHKQDDLPSQEAQQPEMEAGNDLVAFTNEEDDNAPMVYEIACDYRSSVLRERSILQAQGYEVVLQSEFPSHVPRNPEEPLADYAKRYSDTMNSMIQRGVHILNDETTAEVLPIKFFSADGREFDVGPQNGTTKKEYREFSEWMGDDGPEAGEEVPERFRKFEVSRSET